MAALWRAPAPRCDPEDCELITGKVDPESGRVPQVRSTPHDQAPAGFIASLNAGFVLAVSARALIMLAEYQHTAYSFARVLLKS